MRARVIAEGAIFALFIIGGLVARLSPKFPVDKTIWWVVVAAFIGMLLIEICFISPYNHAQTLIRERDDARNDLDVIKALPPKKTVHVIIDRFNELIATGESMKKRLQANEFPLPTDDEIKTWGEQIIEIAGRCASIKELAKLRNSFNETSLPELITALLGHQKANSDRIQEILGKITVTKEIIQSLKLEEQSNAKTGLWGV